MTKKTLKEKIKKTARIVKEATEAFMVFGIFSLPLVIPIAIKSYHMPVKTECTSIYGRLVQLEQIGVDPDCYKGSYVTSEGGVGEAYIPSELERILTSEIKGQHNSVRVIIELKKTEYKTFWGLGHSEIGSEGFVKSVEPIE